MARWRILPFGLLLFLLHASPLAAGSWPALDAALAETSPLPEGRRMYAPRLLAVFYAARDHRPVWTSRARVGSLARLLAGVEREGFSPEDFHLATLARLTVAPPRDERARVGLELLLSDALLRYVHHTRYGKLDPVQVAPGHNDRAPVAAAQILADMRLALVAEDMAEALAGRFSLPFWYRDLRRALRDYVAQDHLLDLPPLPAGPPLGLGSRGERVVGVRERVRLIAGESLPAAGDETARRFDAGLREAVRELQRRYGLVDDGVVGPRTLAVLNRPIDAARIERALINLERMRWLYAELPPDHLFVDLAGYRVVLVRGGEAVWQTRAIVGSVEDQTPMFRDRMDHLVINPTWTVPVSIQKGMGWVSQDYLLVDRRSGAVRRGGDASNYRRYQLVQKPGADNALGRVKFMFPNRHAIYLHDTPSRWLFSRRQRTFSHGCIRVDEPLELATALLEGSAWSRERIERQIARGRTRHIHLERPLPVLLYYLTVSADAAGRLVFRDDVYDRDPALREAFFAPVRGSRIDFEGVEDPLRLGQAGDGS
ncbi:L,D-transpeptidase family protein [Marichromatium gracile]|uniref:Murein L,D-transpeptidase YcbB/YkuD n=1 Tax=Marichromatium gracile TaxID=1048 RepID=A0A4R4AD63_MARGR|nr:L,D-transpeptidase family protein [Marichromatium gracile]MBK1709425.1 murein L,D-transpeptidase [Marichromatium gracile]TCW36987.1 murein L,D-transpeptidase YcbB/YkuD [Marichromatium gracile]